MSLVVLIVVVAVFLLLLYLAHVVPYDGRAKVIVQVGLAVVFILVLVVLAFGSSIDVSLR